MLLHCKDCLFRRQLSGQSGFVEYDMVCRKTGAEYRARQVHRTSVLSCHVFEKLRAEYEVLGSISHEFIQKFIGSKIDANSYVHFVESESVNLLEFYRDDFPLTEKVARDVCAYLLTAVSFLHQNDIVHLNIRPDRVFVGPAGEFKLGGFFYAKFAIVAVAFTQFASLFQPARAVNAYRVNTLLFERSHKTFQIFEDLSLCFQFWFIAYLA